jgi:curved DNA-binding protein CbpA
MMMNNRKLTAILLDLHKNARSGILRIERRTEKKQLVLLNGMLAFAESNQPEDHLAKVMVKQNLLLASTIKEIAALMKQGKNSEEAILELPNSNTEDVVKGRKFQAVSIMASLWAWTEFDLRLFTGEDLVRSPANLGLPLSELLILSARHAVSTRLISLPQNFSQGIFSATIELADKAADIPFNAAEHSILSALKTPMNAQDLLADIHGENVKPEDSLLGLFALGLIAFQAATAQSVSNLEDSDLPIQPLEEMIARLENMNLYQILSVSKDASTDEIQTAYHELAKQFHPDRFQSKAFSEDMYSKAQKLFAGINEAYQTLKNPDSRAVYDANRLAKTEGMASGFTAKAAMRLDNEKAAEELFQLGRCFFVKGEYGKASEHFKRCIWLRPDKAPYHHYMGAAQSKNPKSRKEAEQHLLKALEIDSMSTESHLELAKLYIQVGLRRKAEQQLQEILSWNQNHQEAQKLLAEL